MPLQVAIVGCGAVAQRLYRRPLERLQRQRVIEVGTLVDPVEAHAAAMAASFPKAQRHVQLETADDPVDLTLVLSPAHLHHDHVIAALQRGSHVLCEKPMANTSAECGEMNHVAKESNRVLAVGMIRRFFPVFAELRAIVHSGRLGHVHSFEYREGHKFEWDVTTPAAFKPRSRGGTGVLFDIGPHVIDILNWILGPLTVRRYVDDATAGVESNVVMEVVGGQSAGTVHLSWDYPALNELRVVGEVADAVVRVDRFDQMALGKDGRFEAWPVSASFANDASVPSPSLVSPRGYAEAMYCQLVQVIRAIRYSEAPPANGRSGQDCIGVLESALAQAEPLPMPWLDPSEQQAFSRMHWRSRA